MREQCSYNVGIMLRIFVACGLLSTGSDNGPTHWEQTVRAKYGELVRKLGQHDASFLKSVDASFVYMGPEGQRTRWHTWNVKFKKVCQAQGPTPEVSVRVTEMQWRRGDLVVSYLWRYRDNPSVSALPRLPQSISTDTWRIVGSEIHLVATREYRPWDGAATD